jgi:hypothetical protein
MALDDRERLAAALVAYRELGLAGRVAELEQVLGAERGVAMPGNSFRKEGDGWAVRYDGRVSRLKDVKGLRDLAVLLAQPGREVAAVDLAGAPGAPVQGDLGAALDARAKADFKARLTELEAELEEADTAGDAARSARAEAERAAILAELAAAFGLGGRPRPTGAHTERARQAVTWRIRDALARIEGADAALGRHLRRSVRTGTYCAYDPAEPVEWSVQV